MKTTSLLFALLLYVSVASRGTATLEPAPDYHSNDNDADTYEEKSPKMIEVEQPMETTAFETERPKVDTKQPETAMNPSSSSTSSTSSYSSSNSTSSASKLRVSAQLLWPYTVAAAAFVSGMLVQLAFI